MRRGLPVASVQKPPVTPRFPGYVRRSPGGAGTFPRVPRRLPEGRQPIMPAMPCAASCARCSAWRAPALIARRALGLCIAPAAIAEAIAPAATPAAIPVTNGATRIRPVPFPHWTDLYENAADPSLSGGRRFFPESLYRICRVVTNKIKFTGNGNWFFSECDIYKTRKISYTNV